MVSIVPISRDRVRLTWIFAVHSEVMLVIFDPDTPGGLRPSMDWR